MNHSVLEPADFVLRTVDEGCVCTSSTHCGWHFGTYIDKDFDISALTPQELTPVGECLCCERQVYSFNETLCDCCGCRLCHRCWVHGRYDTGILSDNYGSVRFCYCCRQFGFLKNYTFWFTPKNGVEEWNDIYLANIDWLDAAWYY